MNQEADSYSIREKNLWFELLVDIAVALYYWPKAFGLMRAGDDALIGSAMVGLITGTVVVAVVVSCALSVFLHTQQKPEPKDERDRLIEARSGLWSHRVLVAGVVLVMGQVVVQQLSGAESMARGVWQLTPLLIAHLLLVALMLASFTNSIVRLVSYRRGY